MRNISKLVEHAAEACGFGTIHLHLFCCSGDEGREAHRTRRACRHAVKAFPCQMIYATRWQRIANYDVDLLSGAEIVVLMFQTAFMGGLPFTAARLLMSVCDEA